MTVSYLMEFMHHVDICFHKASMMLSNLDQTSRTITLKWLDKLFTLEGPDLSVNKIVLENFVDEDFRKSREKNT